MVEKMRWAAAAALALALTAVPASAGAAPKIAVVDVRRAVLETEEGLRLQATLKRLFDRRQDELNSRQAQLQQQQTVLTQKVQAGNIPQAQLQKDAEALQKGVLELQQLQSDYTREMQGREQQLTAPILNRIMGLVRKIAADRGAALILERSAVPYFKGDLDITDKAIQMYNAGQVGDPDPATPAAPPPAQPKPAPAPAPKKK
jgi:outer membrane protein